MIINMDFPYPVEEDKLRLSGVVPDHKQPRQIPENNYIDKLLINEDAASFTDLTTSRWTVTGRCHCWYSVGAS